MTRSHRTRTRYARRLARAAAHQRGLATMTEPPQLAREHLRGMSPEHIEAARLAGRLDHLLGVAPEETAALDRARSGATLTPSDVRTLYAAGHHDHIEAARAAGRINYTEGA